MPSKKRKSNLESNIFFIATLLGKNDAKYTGELNKPFSGKFPTGILDTESGLIEYNNFMSELWIKKMELLKKHFKIDKKISNSWLVLASILAHKYVPGFQIRNPSGAKQKWSALERSWLKIHVDAYIKKNKAEGKTGHQISVPSAIRAILKTGAFKDLVKNSNKPEETLRKQYYLVDQEYHTNFLRDLKKMKISE